MRVFTHILLDLGLGVLGHLVDALPGVGAVGDAEAKLEVICAHQLALHIKFITRNVTVRVTDDMRCACRHFQQPYMTNT
jgi:hypothetical protein